MKSDDLDQETLIQRLVETLPCSECGGAYGAHDVRVVEQLDDAWTLVAVCPSCGVDTVIRAYVDIIEDDTISADVAPPDVQEVVAWRQFLALFDGDLRDLLRY